MWIANNWKDYEVLDTSGGEKLERWGKYILVRPDPQVIWGTPHDHPGWKKKNGHYHRSAKGGGEWEFFDLPDEWTVSYPLSCLENQGTECARMGDLGAGGGCRQSSPSRVGKKIQDLYRALPIKTPGSRVFIVGAHSAADQLRKPVPVGGLLGAILTLPDCNPPCCLTWQIRC